jgi:VPDSG-CTERM exosortase interaction domain
MKNLTNAIRTILATSLVGSGLFCQHAQATTINGTITFNGTLTAQILSGGTIDGINWGPPANTVSTVDGDYSSVPIGTSTTFTNFQWNSSTLAITSPSITPFVEWTFTIGSTTYDFILDTPLTTGTITHTKVGRTNVWSVKVLGSGTAQITGFEDTVGVFTVSGTGNAAHLSFDASGIADGDPVPDGGSAVALLGIALTGLEILRRKRRCS